MDISTQNQVSEIKIAEPSLQIGELFGALAKAQMEMEIAKQEARNPFFKSSYADLAAIVTASRPHLTKNGLCVIQKVVPNEKGNYLHTVLGHTSGQWIESRMIINPPKNDIQTIGSYITYLRRYSYSAMVGVVSADEDDDGEKAMKEERKNKNQEPIGTSKISKEQLEIISNELEGHEEILESLLSGFKINKLSDLPSKKYKVCVERIREIKKIKQS